jgi:hypothetical protein
LEIQLQTTQNQISVLLFDHSSATNNSDLKKTGEKQRAEKLDGKGAEKADCVLTCSLLPDVQENDLGTAGGVVQNPRHDGLSAGSATNTFPCNSTAPSVSISLQGIPPIPTTG